MTRKLEFISNISQSVSDTSATSSSTSISSDSFHTLHSNTSIDSNCSKSNTFENELELSNQKIVTTFDELQSLKPRSRMPIDIQSLKNELNKQQKAKLNYSQSTTRSFNYNMQAKVITTQGSPEQRKYFSFMTTNKQITNLTQTRRSLNTTEYTENKIIKLNNRYSSSSSSSSTISTNTELDSGCGSSITTRSSIHSDANEFLKKLNIKTIETAKDLHQKSPVKNQVDVIQKKPRTKFITVLFDYETTCRSFNGSVSQFSVKKGERVKIIREYERDFLIATITGGRIGFVPKDYTVDLKEVEKRFKTNLKHQKVISSRAFTNKASSSMREDYENLKLTHL